MAQGGPNLTNNNDMRLEYRGQRSVQYSLRHKLGTTYLSHRQTDVLYYLWYITPHGPVKYDEFIQNNAVSDKIAISGNCFVN